MDLASQVFKVIDGLAAFRLAGANLTVPDGSDESLALYAKDGVTKVTDIEVSETDGGQRITCHLKQGDAAIPKGVYKVRLASHGLDPTDPLTVATLTVTLLEDIPVAPPVPIYESNLGGIKVFAAKDSHENALPDGEMLSKEATDMLILEGEGLVPTDREHPTTGIAEVKFDAGDGSEHVVSTMTQLGDGKVSLSLGMDSWSKENGRYADAKYHFFCYTDGQADTLAIPFSLLKQVD